MDNRILFICVHSRSFADPVYCREHPSHCHHRGRGTGPRDGERRALFHRRGGGLRRWGLPYRQLRAHLRSHPPGVLQSRLPRGHPGLRRPGPGVRARAGATPHDRGSQSLQGGGEHQLRDQVRRGHPHRQPQLLDGLQPRGPRLRGRRLQHLRQHGDARGSRGGGGPLLPLRSGGGAPVLPHRLLRHDRRGHRGPPGRAPLHPGGRPPGPHPRDQCGGLKARRLHPGATQPHQVRVSASSSARGCGSPRPWLGPRRSTRAPRPRRSSNSSNRAGGASAPSPESVPPPPAGGQKHENPRHRRRRAGARHRLEGRPIAPGGAGLRGPR